MQTTTIDKGIFFDAGVLNKKDPRMRFRNSKDPIYVAYEYLDNQSVSQLAVSFVKESVRDVIKFVSKVIS